MLGLMESQLEPMEVNSMGADRSLFLGFFRPRELPRLKMRYGEQRVIGPRQPVAPQAASRAPQIYP